MAEGINEHRIYVGGLVDGVDVCDLENTFSRHGEVFNVSVNERRGYGFVSYYHKQEAQNAIEDMHGSYLIGSPMRVEWALGWPRETSDDSDSDSEDGDFHIVYNETDPGNTTVYCGGLSDITRGLLERTFQPFGEIEEITCFDDSRNYAFVRFATKDAATRAICRLNDTVVDDELITVSWALNPHVRSSTPVSSIFELGAPSTTSESSRSSSPISQDNFDTVMSRTTPSNRTVYVGGLETDVTEYDIRNEFSSYGEIEQVNLFNNYGFIRFSTKVSAALAICACDNVLIINGSTVRCNWAFRPDDDSPHAVEASTTSTSDPPSHASAQSEPAIHCTGLDFASVPEPDEPKEGATNAKETKVEKKVEETTEKVVDLQCKICMDEQVGVVFLPCGHLASCPRCAQRISNCPMCRKRITGKVRTYLS